MALSIGDLKARISGGASNTDQNASLGGVMSTVAGGLIDSQTASAVTNVTGVVFDDAVDNALGNGTLTYTFTGDLLKWEAKGEAAGPDVDVSVDGVYTLFSGTDGYVVVTVTSASLPGSNQNDADIAIVHIQNNLFDDISGADSLAGDVEFRGIYLENSHASATMTDVTIWIKDQPSGPDTLDIGDDAAAVDVNIQTIADEDTVPGSVSFTQPSTRATGINLGTLTNGQRVGFWIRRTIGADNTVPEAVDLSAIGIGFTI